MASTPPGARSRGLQLRQLAAACCSLDNVPLCSKVRHLLARQLFLAGRGFGCAAGRRGRQPGLSPDFYAFCRSYWRRTSDSVAWTSPGPGAHGLLEAIVEASARLCAHRSGQSEGEFISLGHFEQLDLQAGRGPGCMQGPAWVSHCPGLDSAPPKSRGPAAGPLGKAPFCLFQRRHPPSTSFSSQVHGCRDGDPPRSGGFRHQRAGAGLPLQCRSCRDWSKFGDLSRVTKATCPWWPRSWSKAGTSQYRI